MTRISRSALGFVSSLALPLLFGAAAFGQGMSTPGGMSGGMAPAGAPPAMPGAPMAAPGMVGSMASGGVAPGMSSNRPSPMSQGMAPGTMAPAPPVAPIGGTTMTGGSATNGPVMTALHGTVYQTHKTDQQTEGFLTVHNQGAGPDTLTAITCPIADSTMLVDAGGTTLNGLDVAAGKSVVLTPKGVHLELRNIHFQVFRGSILPCVLNFRTFGQIQVMLYAAEPDGF